MIFFDFDGVLCDSHVDFMKLLNDQLALHQVDQYVPSSIWDDIGGVRFDVLLKRLGLSKEKGRDLSKALFTVMEDPELYNPPLFSFADDLVVAAGSSAIISSSSKNTVRQLLAKGGLENKLSHILGGDQKGSKAQKIRRVIEELALDPGRCIMVGDAQSDIAAGKEAGIETVAVTWGWQSRKALLLEMPDHVFTSPQDLIAFFMDRYPPQSLQH